MSELTILTYPTPGCDCGTFTVMAHGAEIWEMSCTGEFLGLSEGGANTIVHRLSIGGGNLFTRAACGAEAGASKAIE